MFKEETYPKPIFSKTWAVVRTDIEVSAESLKKKYADAFIAYDSNMRPHIYLTEEQANRVAAQMRIEEPERTFAVREARMCVRNEKAVAYNWSIVVTTAE